MNCDIVLMLLYEFLFKNFVLITGHFPSSSVRVTDYWISNVSRDILSNNDSKVLEFRRFEVGEGVEIVQTDFATEVMSQLNKS